ncbi:OLC1v1024955C1 [Oldenlandia corymbosa var. corymbosa]|uniref:OLC1v1024955C1 n=1 Tax=Oldenlandia corymbosa var. corymbosa TaxID=529605 RepID=A0AAV1C6Z5_OLDCO|nr:OLC1v1024955C1 [Oldenlandia corymbosa var. corymbosa]
MPPPLEQPPPPPSLSPAETLDDITQLLTKLLPATLSITSFASRWQVLRSKLASLKSMISELSDSSHWSDNPLVLALLPNLYATLVRVQTLCHQCCDCSFTPGKLLMQSDLDMCAGWLSKQIHDLDLLLRSGVLRQSTAIVLSHPSINSSKEDLSLFVKDLFTRLQIGGTEFKKKALDSLIQLLSEDDKAAVLVSKDGDVGYLISLLDVNNVNPFVREQAVLAVSMLASINEQSRKCVFEEGALGPLLRIIDSGSMPLKEKAALALECITADPENAWAVSAYGGVSILVELCKSGSVVAQSHAIGVIRNVSTNEDVRTALAEEGAIPMLLQFLVSGDASVQEKAANCVAILASSSEYLRSLLLREKGLHRLLQLLNELSNSDTMEHVLRAIFSLSGTESAFRILSSSTAFIVQVADLIKHGNLILQHISASLLAKLSISENNKRAISGCMGPLVKLMESAKPDGLQEVAANALVSLLAVRSNRKELVRDEKSVMRLVQMLDPRNDFVSKKFPIAVVSAIMAGGSQGCRKRLLAAGAYGHLQRLVEMEVVGAKKALQRLSGNRLTNIFTRTWRE